MFAASIRIRAGGESRSASPRQNQGGSRHAPQARVGDGLTEGLRGHRPGAPAGPFYLQPLPGSFGIGAPVGGAEFTKFRRKVLDLGGTEPVLHCQVGLVLDASDGVGRHQAAEPSAGG